jgi:ribonuclease HIII
LEATTITRNLAVELAPLVRELLTDRGFRVVDAPYAFFTARAPGCTVTFYESGKLVVQGRDAPIWSEALAPGALLGTDETVFEAALRRHPGGSVETWVGSDESGKGDYFGPLVVAAAGVRRDQIALFQELGVADCKQLSDAKVRELTPGLEAAAAHAVVILLPPRYNALYVEMGSNLNRLLAWGHARALEDVLAQVPEASLAVVDQFGPEIRLERALMARGRSVRVMQRPRAEDDPAVAIASILARDAFVRNLRRLGRTVGIDLPKGAGPQVLGAARRFVAAHGRERLGEVAKLHFKTTGQI